MPTRTDEPALTTLTITPQALADAGVTDPSAVTVVVTDPGPQGIYLDAVVLDPS